MAAINIRTSMISVIITTHNRLELLKRAYASVLNQTYRPLEIIIVDDASNDGTQDWARRHNELTTYIRIPRSESKGACYARNVGISNASGEFIALLDDDDYWFPNKLEEQIAIALKGYDVVSSKWAVEDSDGQWYEVLTDESDWELPALLRACRGGATSVPLLNKASVIRAGLFDEHVVKGQDHDLWIRLMASGCKQATVQKVLVKYFHSDDSRFNNPSKLIHGTEYKLDKYRDLYDLYPEARQYVLNETAYSLFRYYGCRRQALSYKMRALKERPFSFENLYTLRRAFNSVFGTNRWVKLSNEPNSN